MSALNRTIDIKIQPIDIDAQIYDENSSSQELEFIIGGLIKGDKGDKGDTSTIRIGSVTNGSSASVQNVGTETDAVFNFVLPRGQKGDTGQRGPTGPQGEAGQDGYTPIKGQDYYTAQDIGEIESYVINELIDSITITEQTWAKTTAEAIAYMKEHHTWQEGVVYYTVEEDDTEQQIQEG